MEGRWGVLRAHLIDISRLFGVDHPRRRGTFRDLHREMVLIEQELAKRCKNL